ncbi:MAG: trypsin-like peptidase domain-containing protein [Oscillospiraceae bacterium]|nr:trypsin-like peptidase domain-containing protein [Oscillospiraceae bacterium]
MNENPNTNYSVGYDTYPAYNAQPVQQPAPKKKKGVALKVIAIVLVCVIVGGFAGLGVRSVIKDLGGIPELSARTESPDAPQVDVQAPNGTRPNQPTQPTQPAQAGSSTQTTDTVAATGQPLTVQTSTGSGILSGSEIYEKVVPACVGVVTPITQTNIFGQEVSTPISGSGFIITEDGYILTNYHVVEEANKMNYPIKVATYAGDEYDAVIVGYDEENDVALLKIDATGLATVTIGSIEDTKVGETVYAIGNPLGELTYTFTNGIVSALDREINTESGISINMFQTNVAINAGNSGGPIINSRGEVVGIASAKYSDTGVEGLGFAIPIDDAMKIANDIVTYGFVRGKPYFGITVATAGSGSGYGYGYGFGFGYGYGQQSNTVSGAEIRAVDENSCAAKAGLEVGDIITKLGDQDVRNQSDLIIAKAAYHAGDTAILTIYRDGEYLEKTIVFDELVMRQNTGSVQG